MDILKAAQMLNRLSEKKMPFYFRTDENYVYDVNWHDNHVIIDDTTNNFFYICGATSQSGYDSEKFRVVFGEIDRIVDIHIQYGKPKLYPMEFNRDIEVYTGLDKVISPLKLNELKEFAEKIGNRL